MKHHRRVIEALSCMIIGSLISALSGINTSLQVNFYEHDISNKETWHGKEQEKKMQSKKAT